MDRWCPTCNTQKALANFRSAGGVDGNVLARDCRACERRRRQARARRGNPSGAAMANESLGGATREFPGLDMDRIYRTRPDLVRKR